MQRLKLATLAIAVGLAGCTAQVIDRPVQGVQEPSTAGSATSTSSGSTGDGSTTETTTTAGDEGDAAAAGAASGTSGDGTVTTAGSGTDTGSDLGSTGGDLGTTTTGGDDGSASSAASTAASSAASTGTTGTHASSTGSSGTHASSTGSSGSHASSSGSTTGTHGSSSGSTGSTAPGASEAVGTVLQSTTDVNLRIGPSTSLAVVLTVPSGSQVKIFDSPDQKSGFFNISYGGIHGWSYATYYTVVSRPSATHTDTSREAAVVRAEEAMGFSYWWGHGRFVASGVTGSIAGTCSGSCPSCTHGGSYGGDCSGMVAKAWSLGNTDLSVDGHPYSTADFVQSSSHWTSVSRSSVTMGDALVYNQSGEGHIFLYETGDGWGSMWAFECKGCSYGCVHDLRTAGTAYSAIKHAGW